MNVLLVFEQLPETIQYIPIPDVSQELLAVLETCNGRSINFDEETPGREMEILNDALSSEKEHCRNPAHPLATTITNKLDVPPEGAFDRAFCFGFIM